MAFETVLMGFTKRKWNIFLQYKIAFLCKFFYTKTKPRQRIFLKKFAVQITK